MVREFEGKEYWAVILGGSSGLGSATAKELAARGMNICIVHRDRRSQMAEIEQSFKQIEGLGVNVRTFNGDCLKDDQRNEIIEALQQEIGEEGRIRVLVHSVAKGNLKPMVDTNGPTLHNDDFHLTLDAMAISLYDWTKAILRAGMFADDARVLSFTSEGSHRAWKHYAAVSAAKASMEAITRSMALELAPFGIRANCIQAGVTDTSSLRAIPDAELLKGHSLARNPFGRLTTPEDVAKVVFLLSRDEAAWINGAVIPVDGGESIA